MAALGSFIGATLALLILGAIFYGLLSLVPSLRAHARRLFLSAFLALGAAIVVAAFGMADGGPLNWGRALASYVFPGVLLVVIAAILDARGQAGPPPVLDGNVASHEGTALPNAEPGATTASQQNDTTPLQPTPAISTAPPQSDPPPQPKRLHIRGGLGRLAIVITAIYGASFAYWTFDHFNNHPLLLATIPEVSRLEPSRVLRGNESQNPRVQYLLTLIAPAQGGGITYSEEIREALRSQQLAGADTDRFQQFRINAPERLEVQLARRSAGTGALLLPGIRAEPIELPGNLSFNEAKMRLEVLHEGWRWPVELLSGGGACMVVNDLCRRITPAIHCQAQMDDRPHSDAFFLDWLPVVCGDLAFDVRERAISQQAAAWASFRGSATVWFLVWLAAFVFGKAFWWIIAGFRQPSSAGH
ncbi:MAG: hypothetical protein ABL864_05615 [Terricaulis sp.]